MHNNGQHIDYDLLMLYLTKEADTQQVNEVEEWLGASEENRIVLDELEKLWIETGKITPAPVAVDTDMAWKKVFSKIKPEETKTITLQTGIQKRTSTLQIVARIAAVLLIMLGGYGIFKLATKDLKDPEEVIVASIEAPVSKVLPDESKIDLNEGSKLTYPEKFSKKTREVKLEGEAFFDVAENAKKPFVIHTEIADITVLGTSFNVKAFPNTNKVEVIVETGKVMLTDKSAPLDSAGTIILEAGTMGIIDKSTGKFEKVTNADRNKLFWKTNKMVFNRCRLGDIFAIVAEHFNVTIEAENPKVEDCKLTVTFENNGLEYILDVITITGNLTYRKENDVYIIEGNDCE